jgi:hypothetical protein
MIVMKTFSEIFYESPNGKNIWKLYGSEMKEDFRVTISLLKYFLTTTDFSDSARERRWIKTRRLEYAYNAVLSSKYTNSGLCTKDCYEYIINGKVTKLVKDHFYGVTEVSITVRKALEDCGYQVEYMVDEWLPKNYHLFVTWFVTPEEHKGENIKRAKNTIEEKDKFEHLINVSEVVEKKTRKTLTKL